MIRLATEDRDGRLIVLLDRVWTKVLARHQEFDEEHAGPIGEVLRDAAHFRGSVENRHRLIAPDPTDTTAWIVAVVDYGVSPARIVTIYPQSRAPKENERL